MIKELLQLSLIKEIRTIINKDKLKKNIINNNSNKFKIEIAQK